MFDVSNGFLRRTGAVVLLLSLSAEVSAQQPRTRTLNFDVARKEWVELPPPQPGTAAGDLHRIRVALQEERYRRTLSGCKKFVNKYGEQDPLFPEVMIARASAQVGRRHYDKAHRVLQTLLDEYARTAVIPEALRVEFVIAEAYLAGARRKFLGIGLLSGVDTAYVILDEISTKYPDSSLAELAIKTKADHLFRVGEHALAELEYERLLRDYPRSRYQQFALRRSADAALASFGGVDYDDAALIEAAERFEEYRLRYGVAADHEEVGLILDGIRDRQAEKEFRIGTYYERTRHLSSAIFCYNLVRRNWPQTLTARLALAQLERLGALESTATEDRRGDLGTGEKGP